MPTIGIVCAEGDDRVCVLHCYIIAVCVIAIEFKKIGDPVVGIISFQLEQQLDRQLAGFDVAGYCQQFSVVGVEGEQNHVVHFESQLVEMGVGFNCHQFRFFEIFLEGCLDPIGMVGGGSEAAGDADG